MAFSEVYSPRLGAFSTPPAAGVRRLRLLAAAAAVLLAAELVYIPFHSPRFAVTAVVVRGDAPVAAQVAARIKLPANTNLFLAPTGLVKRQAEGVAAVREASVSRDWRRQLVVTVERREAMAVIRDEKQARLVDPTGVVFTIRNEGGWGFPELVAPHLQEAPGSPEAKAEVGELLGALRALGPDPRLRIARLQMDRAGRILATLDSGGKVRFGTTEQMELKTKLLVTVLDQLGAERIEFLDLSDPWAAYWRGRGGAKSALKR